MSAPGRSLAPGWQAIAPGAARRGRRICAVSGKGGVGKTNLMANLAVAASGLGASVLLVDGDLGLANVDVLLGLLPGRDVKDLLAGRCDLEQVLVDGPRGIRILPAASGCPRLCALDSRAMAQLDAALEDARARYDLILVDGGAGVGPSVVGLAAGSEAVLLVTTPEPTSLVDAYAALKVVSRAAPTCRIELLVNGAGGEAEARGVHGQLGRMAQRFLGAAVHYRGHLPRDARLVESVARQRAVVELFPTSPVSRRIVSLAAELLRDDPDARHAEPARSAPAAPAGATARGEEGPP